MPHSKGYHVQMYMDLSIGCSVMNICEIESVLRQLVKSITIWYYTSITYRLASNNPFLCTVASIDEHGAQQINDTHSKHSKSIFIRFLGGEIIQSAQHAHNNR